MEPKKPAAQAPATKSPAAATAKPVPAPKVKDEQSLIGRRVDIRLKNRSEDVFENAQLVALSSLGATTTGFSRGRHYIDFVPSQNIDYITCTLGQEKPAE